MNKMFKTHNPKVGLYSEDGKSYLSLEITADINETDKCIINIHKLDLTNILIDRERIESRIESRIANHIISFDELNYLNLPIIPVDGELISYTIIENRVELSLEDIEKELGYKIKIIP